MATQSNPSANFTVLFVTGSWHVPAHFAPAIEKLHSLGIPAHCPRLPSNTVSLAPNSDLTAPDRETAPEGGWPDLHSDAEAVRDALDDLIVQRQQNVLVVAHSSGGASASEAVTRDYARRSREEKGEAGGIVGIFFVAAALIPVGVSFADLLVAKLGQCSIVHPSLLMTVKDPGYWLYGKMSPSEVAHWSSLLVAQSVTTLMTPTTNAGYLHVPCAYLVTTEDSTWPVEVQEDLIAKARENNADIKVYRGDNDHTPLLSDLDGSTEKILDFVKGLGYNH